MNVYVWAAFAVSLLALAVTVAAVVIGWRRAIKESETKL